jgi:hypothetical protein
MTLAEAKASAQANEDTDTSTYFGGDFTMFAKLVRSRDAGGNEDYFAEYDYGRFDVEHDFTSWFYTGPDGRTRKFNIVCYNYVEKHSESDPRWTAYFNTIGASWFAATQADTWQLLMETGPTNGMFTTSVGDETVTIDWPPDPLVPPNGDYEQTVKGWLSSPRPDHFVFLGDVAGGFEYQ